MGAFMDRYNRMKGIGTVPDTVQAEGEDSSSVPASEVKPGAFTERYNKLLEARAADMSHSLSEWSAANDTLAHSYGSYSVEELAKQTDALRMSGERLKQRIKDSGLYDDDTVTALGEGIDSWNRVHDIYRRDLDLAAGRAEREQATAKLPASSLPVYGRSPVTAHNGRGSTLEDKILYAQASVDMLESKLEKSKGKTPSPEQLMSGDAGIDGNDEIKAALKEKKKELEQLLKERQESEIAEWREENGLSDGTHVPSSPAQDVEAVLSAKSEYFNPDDNKDPYGNDLRPAVNTVNNIARAGDRVKEAGDLAMSAFSAGIDRSIAGIGDAARTAYETVKGTADRLAGLNQIPELKKYSPAAPEAEKSLTKRLEDAAVAGNRAADNYLLSGDTYTDRSEKDTVMQDYLYRRENQTLGKAGNVIADLAENFGYQMPNMLLTHGLGLTGLSSDAATAIMFGSPAYVSNRRELLEEGYSSAEADLYGKAGFLIEGVGESLFGSAFGTVPAIGRKLGFSIIDNITNPVVRTLMVYLAESGEEGLEEVAQSFLEAAAKSAITGEDFELDAREVAYEGILGAISGGVLGSIGLGQRLRAAGQVHAADVDYVNTLSVNAESVGTAAEAAGMIGALEKQRAALSKMTDETTGLEDTARRVKYLDTALEALSETLKEKFSLAAEITPQGGYEVKDKRNPIERAKDSLTADARSAGSVELALEAASRAADADSAAEAIAALEMQRQRISELGRTGFTARYEDRKMLEAEMKLRDRFGIDGTYFGASVDGKYTPEADGARYSIEQTDRGKPVVVIDTDILNGVSDADKKNAVRKFISQNYPNGIRVGNGVIEVTGKTGKEYTRSGYSQYIEKNDAQVYDDKLRAAGNLNEAVRASTDYVNEEIKHPRKDNIREFARGRVLMRIGQNDYNAEVVVGYTKNGEMLLYDIVNFKPDTFSVKERTSRQPGRGEAGMTGDYGKSSKVEGPIKSGPATTDNSISQNNAAVNSQYTQESENDAADTAENGADTAEVGADEGDFAVDREGSEASAAFGDEALDREGYTPTEQTRVIAMNEATRTGREYGASPAQQAAAEELSHILDRRIVFFRSDDPTVNGYYKNGTIHVNAASGRTVASIIASEMTHAIETTSDYGALRELALRELSREKGMSLDELRAQKKETYAAHGENLDADGVDFELCEEYVGRYLFGDVAQIRAAVDYKPSLGRKIIAFLDEIIRRLTGRVRAVSSRILKDAQYARELWGRAVREAKARDAESKARESGRKNSYSSTASYDFSKPFSDQVDDWIAGKFPKKDTLVVGPTPQVFLDIGFNKLPVTINQTHVDYAVSGTKNADHYMGANMLKQLPNALEHPVAVIASETASGTSVVALLPFTVNGKTVVAPVYVDGFGIQNSLVIDSNAVTSIYGRKNAVTSLLTNAINRHNSGQTALYYINRKEAAKLYQSARVTMPKIPSAVNGFVSSITDSGSPVKPKFKNQTETRQFKRWFGDWQSQPEQASKIVNEDGTPKVVYHGTGANFTVFKSENGTYWFSESIDYAEAMAYERAGKNGRVGAFYLDMKNPYRAKLPPGQFTDPGYEKPIIEKAKSGGYDGVIIENDTDSDIEAETFYVVFSPNQIKSATDNIGTFDRGNNDTRYSIEDSDYEKPITPRDVEAVQSIGRKSINAFTSEEIRKTQKWAHKFYRELGTKSPFFRAWFGDWRAHDTGEVKVTTASDTRNNSSGKAQNTDTGMMISWSSALRGETKIHAVKEKMAILAVNDIETIIRNAIYIETVVSQLTSKSKMPGTAFMHSFYTLYRNGDTVSLLKLFVEEAVSVKNGEIFDRAYQLKDIEKVANAPSGVLSFAGGLTGEADATTYSISDLYSLVKTYDKDFTPAHDVSPELLNEDGTPKVVYHGTGANFTVFKSENGTYWFSESIDYAEAMAYERAGKNGRVGAFYLDMKNPYRAKLPPGQFTDPGYEKPIIEKAKSGGYDGVIIENDTDSDIEAETFYVVFSPNQIKSATDNIGTFDRGNDDTRYSIEDSGWDAYHRRNQEELESNTSAAERARREERAEERAAAEEEARRAAREEEALRRAEQEYTAAEEEGKNESDRAPEAPAWFDSMKKSGSVAEWVMSENNRRSSKLRRYITEHGTDSRDVSAADFAEAAVREIWDGAPASEGLDPELEAFLKEDVRTEIDRQSADLQRKIEEKRERQKKRIETEAEAVRDAKKIDRSADRLIFENDPQERLDAMRRTNRMIGEIVEKSGITAEEKAFAEKIADGTQYAANIPSTMDADRVVHLAWEYMIIKRMNAGEPPTALQRLGIRIASPLVNDYRDAPLLRAWDRDYYRAKSSTSEIISKYELEPKEIADARSIADGYHGIEDFREYSNFKRFAISELADAYALVDSLSKAGIPQQRAATVERFAKELESIIDGIEYAHRRSPLRLTANTMTRNNLAVFGEEKGAKINALLFRPIQLNEAERMRFVNGQFDEFTRTFGKVTEAESAIAQKLIESGTDAEETGKFPTVDKLIESKTDEKRRADEKIEALEAEAAAKEQSREARNRKRKKLSDAKERSAQIEAQLAAFSEAVSAGVDFRRVLSISDYLRGKYAEFYEATNDFLVVHGYRPIGFIKNYAPHMQEKQMTELTEILKRFGLTDEVFELPTEIAGRTKDFKPGKKWNPFHQRRTGKNTVYDAVAGYDRYVRYMSEMFYHTDDIQKLRQFNQAIRTYFASDEIKNRIEDVREAMRKGTMEEDAGNAEIERLTGKAVNRNLSPYVAALDNYTNIIAGKQTAGDRGMESDLGRRTLNIGEKLERRFSAAAIVGNVSSAFAQFVQLPMVAAECGNSNLLRAMRDIFTRELNKKTDFDSRSVFITGKRGTSRLSTELTGKNKAADIAVNKVGAFLFETVDDLASRVIVRTKYLQLVNEGVNSDSALALADEYADSVVGSRMKGAKPIAFCNKNFVWKLLTTFQLEVANIWAHVDQDIPADVRKISRTQGKNAAAKYTAAVIVKYLLGAFLLNRLTDELYGQTPVPFDFAGYALDAAAAGSGMSTNTYLRTALDNTLEKLLKIRPLGTEKDEGGFNAHSALTALGEDVVGDMPVVQNAFGMLGLSDARLPVPRLWSDSASSALEKITSGDADVAAKGWRQFGSAALSNAATWFPFGNQLNKSIRGIYAIARKGSYDYSGRLQYPAGDSVFEKGAAVLFGKSAFNSNADFWAGGSRALSEEATEAYKLMLKYGMSQVEVYRLVKELTSQKADRAEKEEVDVSGMDGFDALAARYFTNDEAEGASGANDFDTLAAKYFGEGDEDEEAEDLSRRVINRQIEIINSDKYDLTDEQKYRVFSEVCASSKAADVMAALDESGAERGEIYRLISSIAATKNTDEEPRAVAHLIRESKLTGEQKAIAYYALAASKKERQVQKELDDLGENSADVWEMLDSCTELRKNEADEERFEKARRVIRESEISKKGKSEAYYLLAASAKDREFMDKVGGDFDMGEIADTLSRLRDCGKQGEKAQVLVDSSGLTVYEKRTVFLERVCTESNRAKKEEALEKIEDAGGSAETYLKALSAVGKATYTKGETLGKSYAYKKAIDRVARGTRLRYALYEVFGVSEKVW